MPDVIDRFAADYHAFHGISPARATEQLKVLRQFQDFAGVPVDQADDDHFRDFLASLIGDGLHPNTVRKYGNMIRPFYGWAFDRRVVTAETLMRIQRVRNPRGASAHTLPKPYERKEIARFWADLDASWPLNERMVARWKKGHGGGTRWWWIYRHAMHVQIEAIASLALHAGLRRDEIYNAALDDIHYDNAYVVVRNSARKNEHGEVLPREVPMTTGLSSALEQWIELRALIVKGRGRHDFPWLSLTHTGPTGARWEKRPMSHDRFSELLGTVGKGYELHRMRHTCATAWLRAGMPLENVSELLGHARLQQTLGYAKIVKTDLARHVAKSGVEFQTQVGRAA